MKKNIKYTIRIIKRKKKYVKKTLIPLQNKRGKIGKYERKKKEIMVAGIYIDYEGSRVCIAKI